MSERQPQVIPCMSPVIHARNRMWWKGCKLCPEILCARQPSQIPFVFFRPVLEFVDIGRKPFIHHFFDGLLANCIAARRIILPTSFVRSLVNEPMDVLVMNVEGWLFGFCHQ